MLTCVIKYELNYEKLPQNMSKINLNRINFHFLDNSILINEDLISIVFMPGHLYPKPLFAFFFSTSIFIRKDVLFLVWPTTKIGTN